MIYGAQLDRLQDHIVSPCADCAE